MSIGDIFAAKELAQTYQPLLLAEFTFKDGNVLRVSTHPLTVLYGGSPSAGSYEFGGNPWSPRVLNQEIAATQAMSDLGVEVVPQVTIVLADPDKTIYDNWEQNRGFKGATLKLYAVMWDASNSLTGSFSANDPAPIKFIGTCSAAFLDDRTLTVTATSLLNMGQMQFPPVRIQMRCAWTFPTSEADREAAATDPSSVFWECGYSYGVVDGVGNPESGTAAFNFCDNSFEACIDRLGNDAGVVPIEKDEAGNFTGRFGGFRWIPNQQGGLQRPYLTGKWEEIVNASNEARYGDFVPMCYGRTWVEPLVMGVWGDGNYTNFEVLLCYGEINRIKKVVVNGTEISRIADDSDAGHRPSENLIPSDALVDTFKNGYWKTVNRGMRNGVPNPNPGWGRQGDPYGSVACIYVSVLRSVAQENSIPRIQVLLEGAKVRVYEDVDTFESEFSDNPAWVLLDILTWSNWKYSAIDIQSFIDAAAKCDEQIFFDRMDGSYANTYLESGSPEYKRFSVGFSLRQRVAVGELIRGVRNAMKGMLYFDYVTGKLRLVIKESIASQQTSTILGSNYNTPVPSVTVQGVEDVGYVAYSFDATNIGKDDSGKSSLSITQRINQDAPNRATVTFQNRENSYSQDTVSVIDAEDVSRIGQEVYGSFSLTGPQTFDHIRRIINTWFAEGYRGNNRLDYQGSAIGDTGGTLMFDFEFSVKALHLTVGQICLLSDEQLALVNQPVRITRIQPSTNFETAKIQCHWHNDNWYQDSFGQVSQPRYGRPRSIVDRKPFAWRADLEGPMVGDAWYGETDKNFGIKLNYSQAADKSQIVDVIIGGKLPVNTFPTVPGRPRMELTGVGIGGGGYPANKTYFMSLAAKDDSTPYLLSAASKPAVIEIGAQTGIEAVVQSWFDEPEGYVVFAGQDPHAMTFQAEGSGTAAVISLTNNYKEASWGAPDEAFAHFRWRIRKEEHAGVWGQEILEATSASLKISVFANGGFTPGEWAGREVSILGLRTASLWVPIANFPVSGNDSDTLFLSGGNPMTCVEGGPMQLGDVVTMRMMPTFGQDGTGNYFEDSKLVNALNPVGERHTVLGASNTSPITIQLGLKDADFPLDSGQRVVVQGVLGNDAANGRWITANSNPTAGTIQLQGSAGDGDYEGGGWIARQGEGFNTDEEIGRLAFIVAGTGRGTYARIKSNSHIRCYIDGDWPVAPDSTSRLVIVEQTPQVDKKSDRVLNTTPQFEASYPISILNYLGQSVFIQAITESVNLAQCPEPLIPFRELYIYGLSLGAIEKDRATFGIGIGAPQPVEDDITPHFMVRQPDGGGTFIEAVANAKINPAGSPLNIDIQKSTDEGDTWASIFPDGEHLIIPSGSTDQVSVRKFADAPNNRVDPGDWLRIDLMVGSSEEAEDIEVVVRWGDVAAVTEV